MWHRPDEFQNVTVHLGAFHTICAFMGAIGKMMGGSDYEEVIIHSGICASGSIDQVMNGKHFNCALRVHQRMLAVVERLLLQVFVEQKHVDKAPFPELSKLAESPDASKLCDVISNSAIFKLLTDYAGFVGGVRDGDLGKTAQFWVQYRDCVWDVMLFMLR